MNSLCNSFQSLGFKVYIGIDKFNSQIIFFIDNKGYIYTCRPNTPEHEMILGNILKTTKSDKKAKGDFYIAEFYSVNYNDDITREVLDEFIEYCNICNMKNRIKCSPKDKKRMYMIGETLDYKILTSS